MFATDQSSLVAGLRRVRTWLCGYNRERCDCKYGAARPVERGGEQCGCPEVRLAAELIESLTPAEYALMVRRMDERWAARARGKEAR